MLADAVDYTARGSSAAVVWDIVSRFRVHARLWCDRAAVAAHATSVLPHLGSSWSNTPANLLFHLFTKMILATCPRANGPAAGRGTL